MLCDDGLNPWCLCLCCRRGNTSTGPPCSLRPSTTSSVLTSNSIRKYIASTSTTSYSQLQLRISRVFLYAYFYQYAIDTSLRYPSGKVVNPVRLESVCMDFVSGLNTLEIVVLDSPCIPVDLFASGVLLDRSG